MFPRLPDHPYKLIAIDLDGTLLSPDHVVTPRTAAAIRRAVDAGIVVCFATGRNFTESRFAIQAVDHFDAAVFVTGAMVLDTAAEKVLHKTGLDVTLARELCHAIESHGHAALVMQDHYASGFDYLVSGHIDPNAETSRWMKKTNAIVRAHHGLATHAHDHTLRVGLVAPIGEVERIKIDLAERFGDRIFILSIRVPAAGVEVLEIFHPEVNKWAGVKHVATLRGIADAEIIAVGDDLNDLAMIANAGLGVAMGNGRDEVKRIAKRVIGHHRDDGLARFIEELVG